jgi:lycopene beta-cyclase
VGVGWTVHGAGGERWRTRLIVDAGGHSGSLTRPRYAGGAALQTAYGIVAHFDRPPAPPGGMVWMDYRAPHLTPAEVRAAPTFLYAMHLGGSRYLVEETSLIARPGLSRNLLKRRLSARLNAQGTAPGEIEAEEWVAFPMNAAAPAPGPVLAFGSAAGLVHPVSGFQVSGALHDAPLVAGAVAQALAAHGPQAAVQAGWAALWPPERRAAREVALIGVDALMTLPGDQLPAFFAAFFYLPVQDWRAFLAPHTDAGTLARTMLRHFAHAPNPVRLPLAQAALGQPAASGRALRAALHERRFARRTSPSRPGGTPSGMTDHKADDQGHTYASDQHEVIEEGMQGATGNVDTNGLSNDAGRDKLEELRANLADMTHDEEQRLADEARGE